MKCLDTGLKKKWASVSFRNWLEQSGILVDFTQIDLLEPIAKRLYILTSVHAVVIIIISIIIRGPNDFQARRWHARLTAESAQHHIIKRA